MKGDKVIVKGRLEPFCASPGAKLPPALKSSKAEESSTEAQPAPAPDEDEQRRSKKKVRFQMDQPWVPPHRRSSDWGDRPR